MMKGVRTRWAEFFSCASVRRHTRAKRSRNRFARQISLSSSALSLQKMDYKVIFFYIYTSSQESYLIKRETKTS